jgi:hypothetical protein
MRTLQRRAVGWLPSRDKRWLLSGLNWKTQWPCLHIFNVASLLDLPSRPCGAQTPHVSAICAWHRRAIRGHVRETVHGRHGEAFLRLSAIRHNLRASSSTSRHGILHGAIVLRKQLCLRDAVRIGILAPLRSARRPWHTSAGVARHGHDRSTPCIGAPISRQTLSHATKASEAPHRWSLSGASVGLW